MEASGNAEILEIPGGESRSGQQQSAQADVHESADTMEPREEAGEECEKQELARRQQEVIKIAQVETGNMESEKKQIVKQTEVGTTIWQDVAGKKQIQLQKSANY